VPPPAQQPVAVGQWYETWPGLRSFLALLVAAGIDKSDPDVQMWWAVMTDDRKLLRLALDNGADPNVTDTQIIRRYPAFRPGKP
jgi:hypothetical protein